MGHPFFVRRSNGLLVPQIQHVDVRSQPYVVGEVVPVVVGIFVDYDVVPIPEPVIAKAEVKRRNAEIEAPKPETAWSSSAEVPDVAAAESAGEVAVLPGMIEVVVNVIAAGVVSDPFAVGVDVGSIGMPLFVVEVTILLCWMRFPHRSGAMSGNVSSSTAVMLCECRAGKQQRSYE